jgi:hypothetical protein
MNHIGGLRIARLVQTAMNKDNDQVLADSARGLRICNAVVTILADIIALPEQHRPSTSVLMAVGSFTHDKTRVTVRILGPTRIDGGLVLFTKTARGKNPEHEVYVLNDFYTKMCSDRSLSEYAQRMEVLIQKAIRKRDRVLIGTTNYFSGITGKVVEIL